MQRSDAQRERRQRAMLIVAILPIVLAFVMWAARSAIMDEALVRLENERVANDLRHPPDMRQHYADKPQPRAWHYALASRGFIPVVFATAIVLTFSFLGIHYLQTGFRAPGTIVSPAAPAQSASQAAAGGQPPDALRTIARLERELETLSRRGNFNLVIGFTVTAVGVGLLAFFVIFREPVITRETGPWLYLAGFAPRLSLVILIEVLAYFFLRLYKASIADIKYYQNEITNIEARHLAFQAALARDEPTILSAVILKLAETERNYLGPGASTTDIEHAKIERAATLASLKEAAALLKVATGKES